MFVISKNSMASPGNFKLFLISNNPPLIKSDAFFTISKCRIKYFSPTELARWKEKFLQLLGDGPVELYLQMAIQANRRDIVQFLLAEYPIDLSETDSNGNTPLHLAVIRSKFKMVQILLDAEGIWRVNRNGNTPFHLLYQQIGNWRIEDLFLAMPKLPLTVPNHAGRTPIELAFLHQTKLKIIPLLNRVELEPIDIQVSILEKLDWYCVYRGCKSKRVARKLIQLGITSFLYPKSGERTLLHWATKRNRPKLITFLIQAGWLDLEGKNQFELTALVWGRIYAREMDAVRMLQALGAKTEMDLEQIRTAFDPEFLEEIFPNLEDIFLPPLSEEYILKIRELVYFEISLTQRLLNSLSI